VWLSTVAPAATEAKIDPGLDRAGATPVAVVVQAGPGAEEAAAGAVRLAGGRVGPALSVVNGFEATVAGGRLLDVARNTAVVGITANRGGQFSQVSQVSQVQASPDDTANVVSTYPVSTGATTAWRGNDQGDGVGVAIIDTGVSPVGDLGRRVVYGPDLSGEGTVVDTYGHGTVMAGLIAGDGADSGTTKKGAYVGMAPKSRVIAVKTAGADGVADVSRILLAMEWVSAYRAQFNIRVLNLAWGTPSTQSPAIDPLNYAVERLWSEGIVVVVAAGNRGPGPSSVTKPADDPMVITAGAYDEGGDARPRNDTMPQWSSRGPTAAGVTKPDLVAPGRTLVSTRSVGSTVESENPTALIGSSYIKGSGTSQAAAVTSGAAALVLADHPAYTPDQVKAVLKATASPLGGLGPNEQGAGRVDVGAALAADPGPANWQAPAAAGLQAGWTGGSWTGGSWTGGSFT